MLNSNLKSNRMIIVGIVIGFNLLLVSYFLIFKHSLPNNQSTAATETKWAPAPLAPTIGGSYWPPLQFVGWYPLPSENITITDPQELAYFQQWTRAMEPGIVNRTNIENALAYTAKEYSFEELNTFFNTQHTRVLNTLTALDAPSRLTTFHHLVIDAAKEELLFYAYACEQKQLDPSKSLQQFLTHPARINVSDKLWAAYAELKNLYPNLDKATHDAIERRLGEFDII